MPFVPDTPIPKGQGRFVPDKPETSWGDVPMNAVKDIGGIAKAGINAAKEVVDPLNTVESAMSGSLQPTKDYLEKSFNDFRAMPGAIGNEIKDTVTHPIETFKQHPVNTALNVGMGIEGLGMLRGAGEVAPVAEAIGKVKPPHEIPIPESPGVGATAESIPKSPLGEVGDFLSKKYENISKSPGWADTVSKYMKEHSQNMSLKTLGASPGQVRKIGVPEARSLGEMAINRDIVGPGTGSIGAEEKINQFHDVAGKQVGGLRKIATQRGAVHDMDQVVNQIKAKLDPIYTQGLKSGEKGSYLKALSELRRTEPKADMVANKVTELFQEAKGQDRLKRPSGAISDVARQLREINDKLIRQKLSPQEINDYHSALDEYGAMTQMKEFVKRRNSTDAGGRLGPGSGMSRMMIQKFMDSVGYRTEAKIMNKMADWIKSNPEAAKSPKTIFKKYADEAVEAMDEMGDQQ